MILLAAFISGASGLIFEMVWFHRAALVFGGSVWSTSLVLSSFMGGLTLGSASVGFSARRIDRPERAYAAAEFIVAVSGLALTLVLPTLTRGVVAITQSATENLWLTNVVRFTTAFAVLLVPSTAMGATLPLLVASVVRRTDRFGTALGHAYGWNTLGAVAGVVVAELSLIGTFGIVGSAWVAAMLSVTAASIALAIVDGRHESRPYIPPESPSVRRPDRQVGRVSPLLTCAFLSGATLLALEVIWFRFLTMYVLSTTLAASLMLAVVLAGIALGGLIASAWLRRDPNATRHLFLVAIAAGCVATGSYAAFQSLTQGVQIAAWYHVLWLACVLTLPAALMSGVFFTTLGAALRRGVDADTRAAGFLMLANTAGGMCGPVIAAFVLLPLLGMERSFFALTAVYFGIAAIALAPNARPEGRSYVRLGGVVVGGAAAIATLVLFPFGKMRDVYFPRVVQPYSDDGSTIVATREGPSETIVLMQQKWLEEPVYSRLVTNGFSMSGTAVPGMRYMRYFVYWPMMLHRGPIKRALVVCYGVGVTASAALDLPSAETIDIAEISEDIVAMSDTIYPVEHPLHDSRVRLHLEDGRQFLQTTTERFDLITGEPPPPRTPGAVNIYTREYFQLIHDRLADGGVTTYWLPVARPDPGTNVNAIIRAFCDVFRDCSLWNATPFDLMLAGTHNSAPRQVSQDEFTAAWGSAERRKRLSEVGFELPQQIGATFVGDAVYLNELTASAAPLVDNHPQRLRPAPRMPSISDPAFGSDPAIAKLYQSMLDPARARQAFAASSFIRDLWPANVLEASLPYFDHQAIINRVFWEGGHPLQQIEHLHWLLTETPLRTLPLWVLGSDDVKERIAQRHDDGTGAVEYARGLSALASRDYPGAADLFARSEGRGLRGETLRPLRVYALCLTGRTDDARKLAAGTPRASAEQKHYWEWMKRTFGIE